MSYRASEHSVKYVFIIPSSPSEMLMHTIEWLLIFNCYDSVLLLPKIWELVGFQQACRTGLLAYNIDLTICQQKLIIQASQRDLTSTHLYSLILAYSREWSATYHNVMM